MTVTLLSTSDINGGASQAVLALHKGLCSRGIDSKMLVASKETQLPTISKVQPPRTTLTRRAGRRLAEGSRRVLEETRMLTQARVEERFSYVSHPTTPYRKLAGLLGQSTVIQLNWVAEFLDWKSFFRLRPSTPLVWRLADMNPMTACCHYADECDKFQSICRNCPQQPPRLYRDRAESQFRQKQQALAWLRDEDLTLVCQSEWMSELAKSSSLLQRFDRVIITNGVDRSVFYPIDKPTARAALGIDQKYPLALLCGFSGEPRKGLDHLIKEIDESQLSKQSFIMLGQDESSLSRQAGWTTFSATQDRSILRLIYSAADLMVFPSLQDNCPNTVLESMACGTPVLAFDGSGTAEIIQATGGGWLVKNRQFGEIVSMLQDLLNSPQEIASVACQCVPGITTHFDYDRMLDEYITLYRQLKCR